MVPGFWIKLRLLIASEDQNGMLARSGGWVESRGLDPDSSVTVGNPTEASRFLMSACFAQESPPMCAMVDRRCSNVAMMVQSPGYSLRDFCRSVVRLEVAGGLVKIGRAIPGSALYIRSVAASGSGSLHA